MVRNRNDTRQSPQRSAEGEAHESFQSYSTQCSLPALAEILADEVRGPAGLDMILGISEGRVLEPFAMLILKLSTKPPGEGDAGAESVSVGSGKALPAGDGTGRKDA